jgi:hypothetical protein
VLGKDPADAKGIVTVEQLPGAIAAVKAAIDADKARLAEAAEADRRGRRQARRRRRELLPARVPLLELLERS